MGSSVSFFYSSCRLHLGEGSMSAAFSGSSGHTCSIRSDQECLPRLAWGRSGASGRGTLWDC